MPEGGGMQDFFLRRFECFTSKVLKNEVGETRDLGCVIFFNRISKFHLNAEIIEVKVENARIFHDLGSI